MVWFTCDCCDSNVCQNTLFHNHNLKLIYCLWVKTIYLLKFISVNNMFLLPITRFCHCGNFNMPKRNYLPKVSSTKYTYLYVLILKFRTCVTLKLPCLIPIQAINLLSEYISTRSVHTLILYNSSSHRPLTHGDGQTKVKSLPLKILNENTTYLEYCLWYYLDNVKSNCTPYTTLHISSTPTVYTNLQLTQNSSLNNRVEEGN